MSEYRYKIFEDGKTVLSFLSSFYLGKEKIKKFNNKNIFINGLLANTSSILHKDDVLTLVDDNYLDIASYKRKINVLYEDEYLLIVNKPSNIVIHSDGALNIENTLSNAVAFYYKNKGLNIKVRYVHRLDKDTTGIVIFAKDPLTESYLDRLIFNHKLHRDYLAIAEGRIDNDIVIDKAIGRDRHVNGKYRISNTGKESITELKVIKKFKKFTLVRLSLKTGRTHQIRVHLKSIGHPILGDTLYSSESKLISRQALHSYYVNFLSLANNKIIEITAELPFDMSKIIKL